MPVQKHKITPEALLELKMPADVRVSADGRRVAFTVSETDGDNNRTTQHIWIASPKEDHPPRRLTWGKSDETDLRWSPDGNWLSFITVRDDSDSDDDSDDDNSCAPKSQVWLLPMDGYGGEAEKLTDAPEGIEAYEWLPDSQGIVYLALEPRSGPLQAEREARLENKQDAEVEREEKFRHQIWQILLDDKKAERIHAGDYGIGELAVSPDGLQIAFSTNYTGEENDYHLVDIWALDRETRSARALTSGPGGKFHPVWTADGTEVLFTCTLDPDVSFSQECLFAVCVADQLTRTIAPDFQHGLTGWHSFRITGDAAIYAMAALGTVTGLFRLDAGESAFVPIMTAEGHLHDFDVSETGGVAFVRSSATAPPEVYWLAPGQTEPAALTEINSEWVDTYAVSPTTLITYSAPDGLPIEALLTLPLSRKPDVPCPLIMNVHGGPHARAVQALTSSSAAQVWAAEGYAVLTPNYRGSEGYGEAFGLASRGDIGGGDYSDIMAGVDWVIAEGLAHPQRLAVIGSSYGAFLVNWIIARGQRFAAAASQFGIYSLVTDFSNSQAPRWDVEYLGGHPWDQRALYDALSPASAVDKIQTPVLIMHGEGDSNTFISNSQEMYQALWLQGKDVEFVRYPREGHGFFEPQHRLDEMRRVLAWFGRYLGPREEPSNPMGAQLMHDGWELRVLRATVETYRGRPAAKRGRWLEVTLTLRDSDERRIRYTLGPRDLVLTDMRTGRKQLPIGLPVESLGAKALAEGRGWKFALAPGEDDLGVAASVAVVFAVTRSGSDYELKVGDFPAVTFTLPPRAP